MSPSSSGNSLEVERYIGSYLISSTARTKNNIKNKNTNNFTRETDNSHPFNIQRHSQRVYTQHANNNNSNNLLSDYPKRYGSPISNNSAIADAWAGGIPLISTANYQRRGLKKDIHSNHNRCGNGMYYQQNQLSRLAIHTTGTPLILAGRYRNKKNNGGNQKSSTAISDLQENGDRTSLNSDESNASETAKGDSKVAGNNTISKISKDNPVSNIDTLSVASDESSGSSNSENCLPRIIKPRKRRKKDRKPLVPNQVDLNSHKIGNNVDCYNNSKIAGYNKNKSDNSNNDDNSSSSNKNISYASFRSSNIVTMKPYIPFEKDYRASNVYRYPYVHYHQTERGNNNIVNKLHSNKLYCDQNAVISNENIEMLAKSLNACTEISEIPKLNHDFEDVKGCDDFIQNQCSPISCQCKVCDPTGKIWGVHSANISDNTYSNELSPFRLMKSASHHSGYVMTQKEHFDNSIMDTVTSTLRRSWSDPVANSLSSFPVSRNIFNDETITCNTGFGVIGAGRQSKEWNTNSSLNKTSSLSSSVSLDSSSQQPVNLSQILDISTEIVTSLNGHRDLEIKFFSSTSSNVEKHPVDKSVSSTFKVNSGDNDTCANSPESGESDVNLEQDCEISYGMVDISTLLLNVEE